jgi:lipoprotein NlpI
MTARPSPCPRPRRGWRAALAGCAILLPALLRAEGSARDFTKDGEAKFAVGDCDGAAADFEKALALSPDYGKAVDGLAAARGQQADYGAAIAAAGRAIAIDPEDAVAYDNRGVAEARLGNFAAAQADFDRALALAPTYGPAYLNRGAARLCTGDDEGALTDLEQAVGFAPQKAASYVNRGWARANLDQLDAAAADCDRGIALEPSALGSFLNRGLVRAAKGETAGALSDLRRCTLDPRHAYPFAPLYLWTVRAQKDPAGAAAELAAAIPAAPPGRLPEWRDQLAGFLLGRLDEKAILADAAGPGPQPTGDSRRIRLRRAQGWYFVGMRRLFAGDAKGAAAAFNQSLAVGAFGSNENFLGRRQLQVLLQPGVIPP